MVRAARRKVALTLLALTLPALTLPAMTGPNPTVHVLLVEDNPDDVLLLRRAFRKAGIGAGLAVEHDGEAAVRFLQGEGAARLKLLVLDLKLPRLSGLEVLAWMRRSSNLRVPVVVLTSSREDLDIKRAYELGANSYLIKPVDFTQFQDMVRSLEQYWLQLNTLPTL